jgi:hypothetical protein
MHIRCSEIQSLRPYPVLNLTYGSPPRCPNLRQDVYRVQTICPRCNKPTLDTEVAAEPMGEDMEFLDPEIEHTVRKRVQAPGSTVGNTAKRHNARDGGRTARRDDGSKELYVWTGRELWKMLGSAPAWVTLWMCMLGAGLENPCAQQ